MQTLQKRIVFFVVLIIITTSSYSMKLSDSSLINEYAQEREFHQKLKGAYPHWLSDGVQAYYKKIKPTTSMPAIGVNRWVPTSVSISGHKVDPNDDGIYTGADIFFKIDSLVDFDPNKGFNISVVHDQKPFNIKLVKFSSEEIPVLTHFDSYDALLNAANSNKLSLCQKVTLKGILRIPGERPRVILVEARNAQYHPITIRGMEVVYDKDEEKTRIFFDFANQAQEAVNYFYFIECNHATVVADATILSIKHHKLYGCEGKTIYGFFDSPEMRNKWIPDETGFYDQNKQELVFLPSCYGDPDDHSETPKDPAVWVFDEGYDSFYQLDSEELQNVNEYIYATGGSLFATLPYKAILKSCFSNSNRIICNYLVQVEKPTLSVHDDVAIVGGHRVWPTAMYKRTFLGAETVWQEAGDQLTDEIIFCNKLLHQDGFNAIWPSEFLNAQQNKQWCDAAQRFFSVSFEAKIHHCNQDILNGFRIWNKLTSLDFSHVQLENGLEWKDALVAIGSLKQLKELYFENNNPISALDKSTDLADYVSNYYVALASCLAKLTKLQVLHLQGLWLKQYKFLEVSSASSADITFVDTEVARLVNVINHRGQVGIRSIIESVCALNKLQNLSIDGIPIVDCTVQDVVLNRLIVDTTNQIAKMSYLENISVYSAGGDCVDVCQAFRDRLASSRSAVVPMLSAFTIIAKKLQ